MLSEHIRRIIEKRGFKEPTLPQKLAIPLILSGNDVLVIAETGTGKTESCMIPIFDLWTRTRPKPISILYITPLKSLNRDMLKRLLWWCQELGIDISVRHGDTSNYVRRMQAEVPPDILVITPETLQVILVGKKMRKHLRNIEWVIVDEVHELVSSKRGTQLAVALERLRRVCKSFQLTALSATVSEPKKVANFISGGRDMKVVRAVTMKDMRIRVISPEPCELDYKSMNQLSITPSMASRLRTIRELIEAHTSTLTFTNTRDFAEVLTSRLKQVYPNLLVENHHSSLSKSVRIDVEDKFKNQELKSIVATSSLELGIDIGSIDFVIQYTSPRQALKLIQRLGRSGHESGRLSEGVIITTDTDDIFESAVIAKRALSNELEPMKVHEGALDVLAHQIVGILRELFNTTLDEVYSIIKNSYPYRKLTKKEFLSVCNQLNVLRYVFINGKQIKLSRKGLLYYFENLSTIPDTKSYPVINILTDEHVGTLDEEFVAFHGNEGTRFIIKGEPWKIIANDGEKIFVEPASDIEAAIPAWQGELMPVSFKVAREVGRLRAFIARMMDDGLNDEEIERRIQEKYPVDANSAKKMIELIRQQKGYGVVPDENKVLIETYGNTHIIHTCLGTNGNETLGRFLSLQLSKKIGSVRLRTDPYRIVLELQAGSSAILKDLLLKTDPSMIETFLDENLSNSRLFQWKFIQVAKRFGVIDRWADHEKIRIDKLVNLYKGTPVWLETLREIKVDKFDIKNVVKFLRRIQEGRLTLVLKRGLSPLGMSGLKEKLELVGPGKPELQILEVFKKRLMNKRVRLVCLNCGEWTQTYFIKDLPDEIRCKRCQAKLLGVIPPNQAENQRIIRKKLRGLPLTTDERRWLEKVERTSDLIIVYQKRAIIALAARGVGPKSASKILRGMYDTDLEFFKALLKAERQFIRTKKYWG